MNTWLLTLTVPKGTWDSLVMSSCSCFSSSEQEYDSLCLSWIAGMPNKSLIAFHARSQKAKDCDFL